MVQTRRQLFIEEHGYAPDHDERKEEKKLDPAAPKRNGTAALWFIADYVKDNKPEDGQTKNQVSQLRKQAAKAWSEATDKVKKPYIKREEEEKAIYQERLKEYEKKGYYTLEDGSKSNEHIQEVKESANKKKRESTAALKKSANQHSGRKKGNTKARAGAKEGSGKKNTKSRQSKNKK